MNRNPAADSAASESADLFARAHEQLLADGSIQFDLPARQPPKPPPWLEPLLQFLEGAFPVLKVLFWALIAAAVLAVLIAIFRRIGEGEWSWPWRRRRVEEAAEDWRPEEAPARALLQEADALAEAGNYAEAAHLLLFRSIEDIDRRRPDLVRPALTSRDIATAPALPSAPKRAFGEIVQMVERSLFGGRALDLGDWQACRAAYQEFAFASAWRD